MHCFAPFSRTVTERVPYILRITDFFIPGIARMVFTNKEKNIAIGRNSWPELRKIGVDVDTDIFYFKNGGSGNDIIFLLYQCTRCISLRRWLGWCMVYTYNKQEKECGSFHQDGFENKVI